MKINAAFFLIIHCTSIMYGCCSFKKTKKRVERSVASINPLQDSKTFEATKALLALMQKNLDKEGRKKGIYMEFGRDVTEKGIALYYYATSFTCAYPEIPKALHTPWAKFWQDMYTKNDDIQGLTLKETPLPEWKQGAGGNYFAVNTVNSIKLPDPERHPKRSRNKIECQNEWNELEKRFDEEKNMEQVLDKRYKKEFGYSEL